MAGTAVQTVVATLNWAATEAAVNVEDIPALWVRLGASIPAKQDGHSTFLMCFLKVLILFP